MKDITDKTVHNEELGQVFTKLSVAKTMVDLFDLPKDACILDPCFGDGVFIEALLQESFSNVVGYEIDSRFVNKLKSKKPSLEIYCINGENAHEHIYLRPP